MSEAGTSNSKRLLRQMMTSPVIVRGLASLVVGGVTALLTADLSPEQQAQWIDTLSTLLTLALSPSP